MPLREVFRASEPSDVEAAQRRLAIAQALQQRAMQPNVPQNYGPVASKYSPANALVDLASALVAAKNTGSAEKAYGRAKQAQGDKLSQAIQQLQTSTPDAEVGAQSLENIRQAPEGQLAQTVTPQSEAQAKLANAMGPDAQQQIAAALLSKSMAPPKPTEDYILSPGQERRSGKTNQVVASVPAAAPKRTVEWKDTGSMLVPKYSDDGKDVPDLKPMPKTATPAQLAATTDGLNDDAKQLAVDRLLAGEKPSTVLGNLGRGAQGAKDLRSVQNLLATTAKQRGVSGPMLVKIMQSTAADGRAVLELGAREGKIAARVQEAQNFAQVAKAANADVPRGKFVPWNKLSQMSDEQMSDPKLAKLKASTVSLINAYAGAVGGGVMHVHDQQTATSLLSAAQSPEAYTAVVDQLILETEQALAAPEQVRERMTGVHPQDSADLTPAPNLPGVATRINSDAEYDALPSGAEFTGPDGKKRKKP